MALEPLARCSDPVGTSMSGLRSSPHVLEDARVVGPLSHKVSHSTGSSDLSCVLREVLHHLPGSLTRSAHQPRDTPSPRTERLMEPHVDMHNRIHHVE